MGGFHEDAIFGTSALVAVFADDCTAAKEAAEAAMRCSVPLRVIVCTKPHSRCLRHWWGPAMSSEHADGSTRTSHSCRDGSAATRSSRVRISRSHKVSLNRLAMTHMSRLQSLTRYTHTCRFQMLSTAWPACRQMQVTTYSPLACSARRQQHGSGLASSAFPRSSKDMTKPSMRPWKRWDRRSSTRAGQKAPRCRQKRRSPTLSAVVASASGPAAAGDR